VQQLAIHTLGGGLAQSQMVIVPASGEMKVEAFILNKDFGFVHEGQDAAIMTTSGVTI
jgi:hemolysin D